MSSSPRVRGGVAASCLLVFVSATGVAQTSLSGAAVAVEDAYVEHINYAYAQVLRVVPVYRDVQVMQARTDCADAGLVLASAEPVPAARAAAVGALLHTGFAAAAASPGQRHDEAAAEPAECPLVDESVTVTRHEGYDVEYRYRGEVFVSRLDHDPGDRLRIRVAVIPATNGPSNGSAERQAANPTY